jgi:hypothetical protein
MGPLRWDPGLFVIVDEFDFEGFVVVQGRFGLNPMQAHAWDCGFALYLLRGFTQRLCRRCAWLLSSLRGQGAG